MGLLGIWVNAGAWEWEIMTVDTTQWGSGHYGTAIALDSLGNPHLAYRWGSKIVYARWDSVSDWWIYEAAEDSISKGEDKSPGAYPSLALDSKGYPHITFWRNGLCYVWKDSAGWHAEYPYPGPWVDATSLVLDKNDYPHIAWGTQLNESLGVVLYTYWDEGSWNTEIIDSVFKYVVGYDVSICLDKGDTVHISYARPFSHDRNEAKLGYAKLTESGWAKEIIIDPWDTLPNGGCGGTSMKIDSDNIPRIAYGAGNGNYSNLSYAEKTDTEWCIERVDTNCGGTWCSLCLDENDNPHITYKGSSCSQNPGYSDTISLMYAWRCNNKWYIEEIDSCMAQRASIISYTGLVIDKTGYSHISYGGNCNAGSCKMKYAKGKADTLGISIFPQEFKWSFSVYPSLASREIKIVYSLGEKSNVDISVYDIAGRKIKKLVGGEILAGKYEKWYEIDNLSNGIYFCILKSGKVKSVKKFVLIE